MRSLRYLAFRIAVTLLFATLASAGAAEPYPVAGHPMQLPAPPALLRVSDSVPEVLRRLAAYAPAENRVIEIYVTPEDHATFRAGKPARLLRFAQLAVLASSEAKPFSTRGFHGFLAGVEQTLGHGISEVADATHEQVARANAELQAQNATNVDVLGYHGAHRREDRALFFSMSAAVDAKDQTDAEHVYTAAAFVLIDTRILLFTVYAEDDPPARAWARHTLDSWVDAARQANPDTEGLEALSALGFAPATQRILLALAFVLVIAVVAVAIVAWQRRRRALHDRTDNH